MLLKKFNTVDEYKNHFLNAYCRKPIITFDGIPVYFDVSRFSHCFYESSKRDGVKDMFSTDRAERIDWIKLTLENKQAKLYQGWDKNTRSYDCFSRVAIVYQDYVVVIRLLKNKQGTYKAKFITAYVADNSINKIIGSPEWKWEDLL